MTPQEAQAALVAALDWHDAMAIAVSGGVDSMTLAFIAHRFARPAVTVVHAQSPAVPQAASARVRRYAQAEGWTLLCTDAGEFADPRYRANPRDRCYFCKSNLYDRIRALTTGVIASGTNRDDLSDYRPGLLAAGERGVVHPFVQAGLAKADIYALAAAHGLDDLAALPAQPCLSSRIETGIAVDPVDLAFIEAAETALASWLPGAASLRCRITRDGVHVECHPWPDTAETVSARMAALCAQSGRRFAGLRAYRRGSAFLTGP